MLPLIPATAAIPPSPVAVRPARPRATSGPGRARLLALLCIACWAGAAHAADDRPPGPRAEAERPGYAPAAPAGLFTLPPVPPLPASAAPSAQDLRFELKQVVYRGHTALSAAELDAIAAPLVGQVVTGADLETLRVQLTRAYVDRGYLNSGLRLARVVPAEGRVEFDVIEGRLSGLRLRGMERLNEGYVRNALQRPGDGPLDIDLLRERFQLLLDDPLFEHLNARLLPGAQPGEAVLDVDVQRARPWQLTLFANNYRPVSVGAASVGAGLVVRNLTGFGDLLDATVQRPVDGNDDLRGSLAWRLPLGLAGTHLTLAIDEGNSSVVEESVRALDIRSRLASREIGLSHVLVDRLERRISLGLQGAWRENRTWLLGQPFSFTPGEPDGLVKERLARFWQEFVQRSQTQVLALRSTFVWGRNNLQPIAGLPPLDQPPSRYRLWIGQAQYARQVADNGAQLVLRGTLQRSPDRLLALDGIAIGGVHTVRGFRENQLVRDQGAVLSVELEWPLLRDAARDLRLTAAPFYDHGRGRNHGQPATTLQSAGVALRAGWRGLSLDLAVAWRLDAPAEARGLGANLQDKGVHLQLAYRF